MIDTLATSTELELNGAEIAFLPVGACEQHFGLLPLNTDIFQSECLARDIGAHFRSFICPPLPYGTSLENTGRPGTLTLMPGTLSAVVRDLVESLYNQGFDLVAIINSHGGNFAIRPAVREINYRNSGRKTIFVDPWELVPPDECAKIFESRNDTHCGEIETSVMLHLAPERVRREAMVDGVPEATRAELDMFSIPQLTGGRPWGLASRATAEKGARYYRLMVETAVAFIRRVIQRHRSGGGSYHG
jgi:creatinine amidohydrolase